MWRTVSISRFLKLLSGISCILLMSGCTTTQPQGSDNGTIQVEFTFKEVNTCVKGLSPEIKLGNVPPGTVYLKAMLKDLFHPMFDHGGGVVPYDTSNIIPEGALKSYYGPCPDKSSNERNKYCFTIQALDANQQVLAWGKKCITFGWGDL
jgi:hypothetical protein